MAGAEKSYSADIPTRVGVLEHGVQELKAGLESHRGESREGFRTIDAAISRLAGDIAKKAQPTNWFAILAAGAATVSIVGGIFALAEWRITTAQTVQERVQELRLQLTIERALNARARPEAK